MKASIARYAGRCDWCRRLHVRKGDTIIGEGRTWGHRECYERRQAALTLQRRVESLMLADHNVAMGCFGIPDGATATFSRGEFLAIAEKRSVVTTEESLLLRWLWGTLLHHDLTD